MNPGYPKDHRRSRVKRRIKRKILSAAALAAQLSRVRLPRGIRPPPDKKQPGGTDKEAAARAIITILEDK